MSHRQKDNVMTTWNWIIASTVLALLGACGAPDRSVAPEDGGSAGGSGAGCDNCDPRLEQCFNNQFCVAKLMQVTGGYSIDATEVTRSQYAAWLATTPPLTQDPWCSWNTAYAADGTCMGLPQVCQTNCDDQPQVCVDWCDAYAYCKGVGKRLCGKIGGGSVGYTAGCDNASVDQWYNACSSGAANNMYPYGTPYDGQACNGTNYTVTGCATGSCTTVEAGSLSGCESSMSGYTGVYDLSGNVWEWEDSCSNSTGQNDSCCVRGGSFEDSSNKLRCTCSNSNTRFVTYYAIGLRCCGP